MSLLFFIFNSSRLNYFLYVYILTQERGVSTEAEKPDLLGDVQPMCSTWQGISYLPFPHVCACTCNTHAQSHTNALYSQGASLNLLLATLICHSCQGEHGQTSPCLPPAALLFGMPFPARLLSPSPPSSPSSIG